MDGGCFPLDDADSLSRDYRGQDQKIKMEAGGQGQIQRRFFQQEEARCQKEDDGEDEQDAGVQEKSGLAIEIASGAQQNADTPTVAWFSFGDRDPSSIVRFHHGIARETVKKKAAAIFCCSREPIFRKIRRRPYRLRFFVSHRVRVLLAEAPSIK